MEEFGQDQRWVDLWRQEVRRTRSELEQASLSKKVCKRELYLLGEGVLEAAQRRETGVVVCDLDRMQWQGAQTRGKVRAVGIRLTWTKALGAMLDEHAIG